MSKFKVGDKVMVVRHSKGCKSVNEDYGVFIGSAGVILEVSSNIWYSG